MRNDGLSEQDSWSLCSCWIDAPTREMKMRADFLYSALPAPLRMVKRWPPHRHCEITEWPLDKEARRMLSLHLANACQVRLRNADAG